MTNKVNSFKEPIYTRRTAFNHDYDITLNEITKDVKNNAFYDEGYAIALLDRLELYSHNEKKLFIEYQLKQATNPLRWLLDFERLVENNSWKSDHGFINFREDGLSNLPELLAVLFKDIENKNQDSTVVPQTTDQTTDETIFNTTEACAYLNISKSTIYKFTSNKTIAFYKPNGKNMYFKKLELDEFITRQRQTTNSELETTTNEYLARGWKP